jgi:hypothetical protein
MPPEELQKRLARLLPGETILLSGSQFRRAFAAYTMVDEQKAAASELAGSHGCAAQFIGLERGYAVFTCLKDRPRP